ncbi:MAG: hypothetical protein N2248_00590 [candidate division WOR-3 bacterium]|nr:hypothetical protein [candidate division WOR-3 bacterium]
MKTRWLYVLLAVSLAINLAAFGSLAWLRLRRLNRRVRVLRQIKQIAPRQIEPLLDAYHLQMDSLRLEYWYARHRLARLALEENPESAEVERTLKTIGEIHQQMNRLVYETGRQTGMVLPPEHRERLRRGWCRMMEGPRHPPPPPEFEHRKPERLQRRFKR